MSDDEEEEEDAHRDIDPSLYENFFHVVVGEDNIYIEDPLYVNESGWTALHTCCMSLATVNAGVRLIEETIRLGGNLEQKTTAGPGTFNKGWTALHM